MKSNVLIKAIPVFLLIALWSLGAASAVNAQEVIRYSCSNQVFEAISKDHIEAFSAETGIGMDVKRASSGSCIHSLGRGFCDIAGTARKLYRRHEIYGYHEFPFCKDPVVVIARKECGVDSLTEDQLQNIFAGEVGSWSEVGGADLPVKIVVPAEDTAAHKNFRRQVMKRKDIVHDFIAQDSTMVIEVLKHFPCGAVSFISGGAAGQHGELKTIKIDGMSPADEKYPYYQIFYLVTSKKPEGNPKKFIDFVYSEEGARLITENGMTPLPRP